MTTPITLPTTDSQMHNNIIAAGSRIRHQCLQHDDITMAIHGSYDNIEYKTKMVVPLNESCNRQVHDTPTIGHKHQLFLATRCLQQIPETNNRIGDEMYSLFELHAGHAQEMWKPSKATQEDSPNQSQTTSESASEEDRILQQAQKEKTCRKKLGSYCKVLHKKLYKPTNNNLRTSSNTRNKNVDTTPRYKNDNQTGQFGNQRVVNVVRARETVEQSDWLADTDEEIDEQELEATLRFQHRFRGS
ncbi:hypothetical protein Tco_1253891 [Tanacetum coccineum]